MFDAREFRRSLAAFATGVAIDANFLQEFTRRLPHMQLSPQKFTYLPNTSLPRTGASTHMSDVRRKNGLA